MTSETLVLAVALTILLLILITLMLAIIRSLDFLAQALQELRDRLRPVRRRPRTTGRSLTVGPERPQQGASNDWLDDEGISARVDASPWPPHAAKSRVATLLNSALMWLWNGIRGRKIQKTD